MRTKTRLYVNRKEKNVLNLNLRMTMTDDANSIVYERLLQQYDDDVTSSVPTLYNSRLVLRQRYRCSVCGVLIDYNNNVSDNVYIAYEYDR